MSILTPNLHNLVGVWVQPMLPLLQAAEAPVEAETGTGSEEIEERSFEAEETQEENAEESEVGNLRACSPVANDRDGIHWCP